MAYAMLSVPAQHRKGLAAKGADQFFDTVFRVTEQHTRLLVKEKRVLNTCVSTTHAALENDRSSGFPDFTDRHAIDIAVWIVHG